MNLVLFEKEELSLELPFRDERGKHLRKVLKLNQGDQFRAGVVNGFMGVSTIEKIETDAYILSHDFQVSPPPPFPIHLLCGTPRPNSVKRIVKDATTMGVASINFLHSDLGEKSYRTSHIWSENTLRELLKQGASQAYSTWLPPINQFDSLEMSLTALEGKQIIAFDNTPESQKLSSFSPNENHDVVLCIGSERGWSDRERDLFNNNRIKAFSLGQRVMRTDTAFIASLSLIQNKLDLV